MNTIAYVLNLNFENFVIKKWKTKKNPLFQDTNKLHLWTLFTWLVDWYAVKNTSKVFVLFFKWVYMTKIRCYSSLTGSFILTVGSRSSLIVSIVFLYHLEMWNCEPKLIQKMSVCTHIVNSSLQLICSLIAFTVVAYASGAQ